MTWPAVPTGAPPGAWPADARSYALDLAIAAAASNGWRLDVRDTFQARVSRPVIWLPVWAHLILCLCTCLMWFVVWALVRRPTMRRTSRLLSVDWYANVSTTRVSAS